MQQKNRFDYQIQVEGTLSEQWLLWFERLQFKNEGNTASIYLTQADSSELFGVLTLLRDFNLELLFLERLIK